MEKIINKYFTFLFFFIIIIAFILRFFNLSSIPDGLYQDETALGYNAYSILETGKDEHGEQYPIYFKSFGDYKLPIYFYATSLSIKTFGLNEFAVRFPSAFFGVLAIPLFMLIVRKVSKKNEVTLLSGFLLAFTPLHLLFSRAGFEVNIALTFSLFGTLMFLYSLETRYKLIFLMLSVGGFALSLYSYNVTRLLSPLLFLSLMVIYRKSFFAISKKTLSIVTALVFIFAGPFIYTFFGSSGFASAGGALITSKDIEAKIIEQRSYLQIYNYPDILSKLFFNKYIMLFRIYFENLVSGFNTAFYFVRGSEHGNQGIGTHGIFLSFQFPFLVYGASSLFKKLSSGTLLFVAWFVIAILLLGLSKEVPHATRGYFLIIPVTFFTAIGITNFFGLVSRFNKEKILIVSTTVTIVIVVSIIHFLSSFFYRFPVEYAKSWRQTDREVVAYISSVSDKYKKIIFDEKSNFIYTSYLFYAQVDPKEFLRTARYYPDDSEGLTRLMSFDKYEFRAVDWEKDLESSNVLIVSNGDVMPSGLPILKTFYYPKRPVALSVKEEILSYPVEDVSYVVVESQ